MKKSTIISTSLIENNTVFLGLDIPYILIDNIILYLINKELSDKVIEILIEDFDFPHATYARKNGAFSKLCDRIYE